VIRLLATARRSVPFALRAQADKDAGPAINKQIGLLIAQEAALYHENKMRISNLRSQIQN